MANWKYTLEVKDAWKQTKAGEMTISQFAAHAAEKIKALPVYEHNEELFDIADELEFIAADPDSDVERFDDVWEQLYNWGDQIVGSWNDKMCWVRTF